MKNWGPENNPNDYQYVGGCFAKHPFNAEKRAACEAAYMASSPKVLAAQAEKELAAAAAEQARRQGAGQWTATQTAMVAIGSLLAIGVVAVLVIKAKKK